MSDWFAWLRGLRPTRRWLAGVVVLLGLIVTGVLYRGLDARQERVVRMTFEAEARERLSALNRRLQRLFEAVYGLAGFYQGSEQVTWEEFQTFTQPLLERQVGVEILLWAPTVTQDHRDVFESYAAPLLGHPFEIREQTETGKFVAAEQRPVHVPIYFVMPLDGYDWLWGFDLTSREPTREAMIEAHQRDALVATRPITLVTQRNIVRSVWVFHSVERRPVPIEEVGEVRGFVGGAFRMDEMLRGIMPTFGPGDMILEIRDMDAPAGHDLIYISHEAQSQSEQTPTDGADFESGAARILDEQTQPAGISPDQAASLLYTNNVEVAGRRWQIRARPTAQYLQARRAWTPALLLGSGLGISLLLGVYLNTVLARTERVEREVDQRTDELLRESEHRARLAERLREAEAFLESVIEHIPHLVTVKDAADLSFVRVNRAAVELLGYQPDELVGRHESELLPPDEAQRLGNQDRAALEQGRMYQIGEHSMQTRHRGMRIFHTKRVPLRDAGGQVTHLLTISEDITERRHAEQALRESEQRFRSVAETAMDAIITANADDRITYFNPTAEKMFGYAQREAMNQPLTMLLPERLHESHRQRFARYVEMQDPHFVSRVLELTALRRDGREFPVEISLAAHEEHGEMVITGIIRDITERKLAEQRLNETAEALARSNHELEQFAYIASHDLQEPLRKVRGFGDMLRTQAGDALDETARDYLRRMQGAAERMQALIHALLTYSRITTKAQPFERVDLNEIAQQVVDDLVMRLRETAGQVHIDELPQLDADPVQMRQLLQNLISNGLKFHRQGVPPEVRVSGELIDETSCHIRVEDNGIGFEPKEAQRLFKPFQRLHNRMAYEGTGIGLAVCQKIVERHGGSITVDSTPGRGSVFSIVLPRHATRGEARHAA